MNNFEFVRELKKLFEAYNSLGNSPLLRITDRNDIEGFVIVR